MKIQPNEMGGHCWGLVDSSGAGKYVWADAVDVTEAGALVLVQGGPEGAGDVPPRVTTILAPGEWSVVAMVDPVTGENLSLDRELAEQVRAQGAEKAKEDRAARSDWVRGAGA